jgi:putative exosortase-associated protein (TIGR04073 family)
MKILSNYWIILIVWGFFFVNSVLAYEPSYCHSSAEAYTQAMATKLARGVTNVATGWMELPRSVYVKGRDKGALQGMTIGLLQGVGMTVVRTVAGAFEAISFLVPSPGFYDPLLERPLVWSEPNQTEGFLIYKSTCEEDKD